MVNNKKPLSIRTALFKNLKERFKDLEDWGEIETPLSILCSGLPEPTTEDKEVQLKEKMKGIKLYLAGRNIPEKYLTFIDELVSGCYQTKLISKYKEEDSILDDDVIAIYSHSKRGEEGVIGINQKFNYQQLSYLTKEIYKDTKELKFFISNDKEIYGKIIAEYYDYPVEIPVVSLVASKKKKEDTGLPSFRGVKLFGEGFSRLSYDVIREIPLSAYIYRFISEGQKEMLLLTQTQHEIGDYIVSGVEVKCDDFKIVSDSARIPTKLPYLFVKDIKNRVVKFKNKQEFGERIKQLNITKEDFFDYPFAITPKNANNEKTWKMVHPLWYKWLIWAWITHEPKGLFNKYPLHLMIQGITGSGKSLLLNGLHAKSKETPDVSSGSGSTLKSLIPSFKTRPASIGYLATSNRFSFCDEFLRCLTNIRSLGQEGNPEESVALMNDLLEHQKREVGSGISKVKINMTSRVLACTNPVKGNKTMEDFLHYLDASFLSRWLIYHQPAEHVRLTKKSKDSLLEEYNFKIEINDWISFVDYLQSFSAIYDLKKVEEIYKDIPNILSENLQGHYDTRHMHHLECLMDGIIKTRCFLENDMKFEAKEEDYRILQKVWQTIIKSWLNPDIIRNIDLKKRIFYLPENAQFIYWSIANLKRKVATTEILEIVLKEMDRTAFHEAWGILMSMGLIVEYDGEVKPYYLSGMKEEQQNLEED